MHPINNGTLLTTKVVYVAQAGPLAWLSRMPAQSDVCRLCVQLIPAAERKEELGKVSGTGDAVVHRASVHCCVACVHCTTEHVEDLEDF